MIQPKFNTKSNQFADDQAVAEWWDTVGLSMSSSTPLQVQWVESGWPVSWSRWSLNSQWSLCSVKAGKARGRVAAKGESTAASVNYSPWTLRESFSLWQHKLLPRCRSLLFSDYFSISVFYHEAIFSPSKDRGHDDENPLHLVKNDKKIGINVPLDKETLQPYSYDFTSCFVLCSLLVVSSQIQSLWEVLQMLLF